ncbi:Cys/Met metabolism, pyridoxal phosphate-dependent enzyme [Metarhizium rileyi]|uniref:Cys/Met metabolism, pyridoxal phosphate-dependent enzyme n=1 Tax=Metarhizium rileyi (strain RCEF 4871) TaxID=1649241 RepID=A0A167A543_METRR|nr:Cys/Met metabolism, pyridoxal phosphate-dependent enzyme [Metarhizium rileyi RCEF 4871]
MTPNTTPLGQAIPDKHHAVSVQLPRWNDVCDFGLGKPRVHDVLKNGYPRTFLHRDVRALVDSCSRGFVSSSQGLALFPDYSAAADCKSFITSERIQKADAVDSESVSLFAVYFYKKEKEPSSTEGLLPATLATLYAVVHPVRAESSKMTFWRLTGRGISSRRAEQYLDQECQFVQIDTPPPKLQSLPEHPVYETLRERIADLLERAPINPQRVARVSSRDVYLHPSGMSAIYHAHHALLRWRYSDIIMLGFPYELSIKMIETLGPPYRFFSFGTDNEIDQLEQLLRGKAEKGEKIQAVWCECPNNPMLRTVDINRVRKLADRYDFLLVIDDTIGSFANVDVQDVADIIVTSLSKNFSGSADVLAGSVVINPHFRHSSELKPAFDASYTNSLYVGDAEQLEYNSRRYLANLSRQNDTASFLADFFHPYVADPTSTLTTLFYPKVCWSRHNYRARLRPVTEDFVPGYGAVLALSFETVAAASAFFDSLDLYKGPSFGATITIAVPYVQLVLQKDKEWASTNGLDETLVRISVGLEDKEALLRCVKVALQAADATKEGIY